MLFNSIEFAIFLPIVFTIYWLLNKWLRWQNAWIVASSFFFYGWWDWRFLFLMLGSALIDFVVGILLENQQNKTKRKFLLFCSLAGNLGILGFFKYFNFFAENFASAFTLLGKELDPVSLRIVLPVGISFYTFQALSYTIDVYRRQLEPTHKIVDYFAFISFFPQLVAGPIERATNLLPQFYTKRSFNYSLAVDGMRQILWGLFKKVVIADNCAVLVNDIFSNYGHYNSSTLIAGALLFAFQIYGDFSGYSDIAIGTARLFGFSIMRNFAFPYFARDIAEFWRRWHISLSTWFRDYVYIPLGGSRVSRWMQVRNTFVIFVVSGFWHGANWTFISWGALNALYFLPLLLLNRNRKHVGVTSHNRWLPSVREFLSILLTFVLVLLAWVFFRSPDIESAFNYLHGIFNATVFDPLQVKASRALFLILFLVLAEWLQRDKQHALQIHEMINWRIIRWAIYFGVAMLIFLFGVFNKTEFIYFAF